MADQNVRSSVGERTLPDTLKLASNLIYLAAGGAFLVGLYVDWKLPGVAIIPWFALANEPVNSGLFILSVLLLVVGYVVSTAADWERERRTEEVDQTQEWTVDVGNQ